MNLIAAVTRDWGIGCDNKLLFDIPMDKQFFNSMTKNKVVIMGRKTFESIGKPLPNRMNVILSTDKDFKIDGVGVVVCNTVSEVLNTIECHETEDVFVIGGQKIYELFLDYCDKAYITHIMDLNRKTGTFFPNLHELPEWKQTSMSKSFHHDYGGVDLKFRFYEYEKFNK